MFFKTPIPKLFPRAFAPDNTKNGTRFCFRIVQFSGRNKHVRFWRQVVAGRTFRRKCHDVSVIRTSCMLLTFTRIPTTYFKIASQTAKQIAYTVSAKHFRAMYTHINIYIYLGTYVIRVMLPDLNCCAYNSGTKLVQYLFHLFPSVFLFVICVQYTRARRYAIYCRRRV